MWFLGLQLSLLWLKTLLGNLIQNSYYFTILSKLVSLKYFFFVCSKFEKFFCYVLWREDPQIEIYNTKRNSFCKDKSSEPKQALDGHVGERRLSGLLIWTRIKTWCSTDLNASSALPHLKPMGPAVRQLWCLTDGWHYIKHRLTWKLLPSQEWSNSNTYTLIYCKFQMFYSFLH